jgi:hypothetical protein
MNLKYTWIAAIPSVVSTPMMLLIPKVSTHYVSHTVTNRDLEMIFTNMYSQGGGGGGGVCLGLV